jgi:hypothetical protein
VHLKADARARAWLDSHPASGPRVIAYSVQRCCGGGKICQVKVRQRTARDDPGRYVGGQLEDGTTVFVDRRVAAKLPGEITLTVSGIGPLKHLDLRLESEQWGDLLYT